MPSPPSETLRALIIDDEPLARSTLRGLLADFREVAVVGEAGGGAEGLRLVERLDPDLLFLDVQMPEVTGLDVLRRMEREPAVVLTTAHDEYAVAAFELGALDYIMKPFGRERLAAALARAVRARHAPTGPSLAERARWAVETAPPDAGPLTRLFLRDRGRILPVRVDRIVRLEGQDDYVAVHTADRGRHLVYLTLAEFERRLDPSTFLRVHRSHIVNLDHVVALTPYDGARLSVVLSDGTSLVASRTCSRALRDLAV